MVALTLRAYSRACLLIRIVLSFADEKFVQVRNAAIYLGPKSAHRVDRSLDVVDR